MKTSTLIGLALIVGGLLAHFNLPLKQPQPTPDRPSDALVPVKNTSGADVGRFEVLGIDDVLYSPSDDLDEFLSRSALKGVIPQTADHQGRFVVMAEPVANNEVGMAIVSGIAPVKVQVAAGDEANQYADVHNASKAHLLLQSSGSAMVLWRESGTGEKWALARLGNPTPSGPGRFVLAALSDTLTTSDVAVYGTLKTWFDGDEPATTVLLYNKPTATAGVYEFSGVAGAYVYAFWSPADNAYIIDNIKPAQEVTTAGYIEFSLAGTLSKEDASQIAVVLRYWNGTNPGSPVTVINPDSIIAGQHAFSAANGTVGLAAYSPEDMAYVIIWLPPSIPSQSTLANVIEYSLNQTLSTSDREVPARVIHHHGGDSPGNTVTLINPVANGDETQFLASGANGSPGIAVRGSNGKYVIVPTSGESTPSTSQIEFAVAQRNWQTSGGVCGFSAVLAKRIMCFDGPTPITIGENFYISLPPNGSRDPNVVAGQIIAYRYVPMTGYVCAGEYLDDKIGTIKASGAASYNAGTGYYDPVIPAGWELFIEAKDKFLMGAGDEETANLANGTLGGSDTTSEETTGITVDDHGHHHHAQQFNAVSVGGSGASVNSAWSTTGNENATQTHTVNDAGHSHTLEPPNIRVFYIIRVDNSYVPE